MEDLREDVILIGDQTARFWAIFRMGMVFVHRSIYAHLAKQGDLVILQLERRE